MRTRRLPCSFTAEPGLGRAVIVHEAQNGQFAKIAPGLNSSTYDLYRTICA